MNFKKIAEETIDKAYDLIEESDTLVSITENGLREAIEPALRQAWLEGARKMQNYIRHLEECNLYHKGGKPENIGKPNFTWSCTCGLEKIMDEFKCNPETLMEEEK